MAYKIVLHDAHARRKAISIIEQAPEGSVFGLIAAGRTISQNAKMWACLTDIALAKPEGRAMSPEAWKSAFMSALGYEIIWQPGIDNSPPFPAGFRTSRLNKSQMADLLSFILEYGDRHGVKWSKEPA